jgi:hypothetical protein
MIKFNAHTKRRQGKVVTTITFVELKDAYYKCSDGKEYAPGSTGGNQSDLSFIEPRITLKGRSFSKRLLEDSEDLGRAALRSAQEVVFWALTSHWSTEARVPGVSDGSICSKIALASLIFCSESK